MSNESDCEVIIWSGQAIEMIRPLFYLCILATITHAMFWTQFLLCPSVRQASMQWLYAYLITDLLLIVRLYFLYIYHWSAICVPFAFAPSSVTSKRFSIIISISFRVTFSLLWIFAGTFKLLEITTSYEINRKMIILGHLLIYLVPCLFYFILIKCQWMVLYRPSGDACDFDFVENWAQIVWLFFSYIIPVTLTFIFFYLSLRFIRDVRGIRTQQIAIARLRYYRRLVLQSSVFYIVSLCLWSPYLLTFPFIYRQSLASSIVQVLSYSIIVLDPIIISALDVRFLKLWRSLWARCKGYRRAKRTVPIATVPTR